MEPFYLEIRAVHIASVLASGALFLLRGLALNLFDASWAMAAPLRYLSWSVDTVLLTAALMLMTIIEQTPFQDAWLAVKVLLVIPYVVLGYLGLRAPSRRTRLLCLAGAVVIFGYIYSVARAHHPLGFLA
jgi:uncharacterized membrane protein SirB2